MSMIFHIAERNAWLAAKESDTGFYVIDGLAKEGFIHLSTRVQFPRTAERYYRGNPNLVLLAIDESALDADLLKYEVSTNDDLFPHYYGPIPLSAVLAVHDYPCRPDGGFDTPVAIDTPFEIDSVTTVPREAGQNGHRSTAN